MYECYCAFHMCGGHFRLSSKLSRLGHLLRLHEVFFVDSNCIQNNSENHRLCVCACCIYIHCIVYVMHVHVYIMHKRVCSVSEFTV